MKFATAFLVTALVSSTGYAAAKTLDCSVAYATPEELELADKEKRMVKYVSAGDDFTKSAPIVNGEARVGFDRKGTTFQYLATFKDGILRTVVDCQINGVYFVNRTNGSQSMSVAACSGEFGIPYGLLLGDSKEYHERLKKNPSDGGPVVELVSVTCTAK